MHIFIVIIVMCSVYAYIEPLCGVCVCSCVCSVCVFVCMCVCVHMCACLSVMSVHALMDNQLGNEYTWHIQ